MELMEGKDKKRRVSVYGYYRRHVYEYFILIFYVTKLEFLCLFKSKQFAKYMQTFPLKQRIA